ncbi:MAG: DUF1499 domain-containing protein [Pseudomonadota bacterium]
MSFVAWSIGLVLAGVIALALFFRLVSDDPLIWHVDPREAPSTGKPNEFRMHPDAVAQPSRVAPSPEFPVTPSALALALDAVALSEPRTKRIAGNPSDLAMTYVQRSAVMGFPDYISVQVLPGGADTASIAVFSRSRFGYSDMGVNEARIELWLEALSDRTSGS